MQSVGALYQDVPSGSRAETDRGISEHSISAGLACFMSNLLRDYRVASTLVEPGDFAGGAALSSMFRSAIMSWVHATNRPIRCAAIGRSTPPRCGGDMRCPISRRLRAVPTMPDGESAVRNLGGEIWRGSRLTAQAGENWGWVSCLCPGFVATDINTSERNRPESAAPGALDERSAEDEMRRKFLDEVVAAGMRPRSGRRSRARRRVQRPVLDLHRPEHGDRARRQARQHHAEPEPGAADAVLTRAPSDARGGISPVAGRSIT
jgi:hypothetical protein